MIGSSLSGMEPEPDEPEPVWHTQHTWWLFGRPDPAHAQPTPVITPVELEPVPAWVVGELFPPLRDLGYRIEVERDARHIVCKVRNPNYPHAQQASRKKIK
jgi:hypothetical protein